MDEATGAVCVETLKRDWTSTLKLRDVLVTISCLLIQPNPASALNEEAGKLANEDWAGFCRRAKLMTEIHAAVPSGLANDVKAAQMRGEEKEAEPSNRGPKLEVRGKGKARVKLTPPASAKAQRVPLVEDEENMRHRVRSQHSESDESDWIPGPTRSSKKAPGPKNEGKIFDVRDLDSGPSLEDTQKQATPADPHTGGLVALELEQSDPFTKVTSRRTTQSQYFVIPISPHLATSHQAATDTPELLKYSHENPYSVIQPNNQQHPLHTEFSYTWQDSEIVRGGCLLRTGESRDSVRKRLVGQDFERKKDWELKRFKKAGFDLKRYNRGDFGPQTGVGRL